MDMYNKKGSMFATMDRLQFDEFKKEYKNNVIDNDNFNEEEMLLTLFKNLTYHCNIQTGSCFSLDNISKASRNDYYERYLTYKLHYSDIYNYDLSILKPYFDHFYISIQFIEYVENDKKDIESINTIKVEKTQCVEKNSKNRKVFILNCG